MSHRRKTWSRRRVISAAAGGTAAAALGALGVAKAATTSSASPAAGAAGDVVGKITVGYQGWFAAKGDGAPINGWWHWTQDMSKAPSPSNTGIKCWPDMRDFTHGYPTAYANLGNGRPATLFSSYDQQTVDTHFQWMQQYGIDTAALQRFNPTGGEGPTRDAMATKVRSAAESHNVKFYIMYDVSGWTTMQSEIKNDWTTKMKAHTASSAYATQNGKPVVCIWGFGFNDNNHPFDPAACLDVINWFKSQGCYVIGGIPKEWRTGGQGTRTGFGDVYHAFNMISPWMVGAIGNVGDSDQYYQNVNLGDQAECDAHGIDYQPCVLPGDVSERQRAHGDFMWRQFYNMVRIGAQGIYISMFDEFNEGNQIAKTAETQAGVPTDSGFLALDEDGTACSSDYYLRLTGDGGRMLKGQLALTATRPTQPVVTGGSTTPPTTPGTGTVVSLRAGVNNDYVTAENAGAAALIANRTAIGPWEQFDLLDAGSGNVALRAHANSRYVTAGSAPLIADGTALGRAQTFTLVRNSDGTVSLLAIANNQYVTAESAGASSLIANRTAIGPWEKFSLITS
ncbi:glycoside hydrolase family 71/99-like protein [Streptomyces sp. NBC_01476]|uniref:glycoside hydrolase family 71/99-like protein n=1 Tax=Streptomyces sp. NBC_01476 TaxID=2903881 RepID=UPI003FCC55D5